MKNLNIYTLKIFFISILLISIKYIVSYFFNNDEDLLFKIIRLADQDFETYALIIESLSRLDLKTDWSNILISNKIIGFPFLSLIWHAIFFNLFNYYSFIILEPIFYFLILLLIFKIFFLILKDYKIAFLSTILLLLSLEILTFLSTLYNLSYINTNFFYILKIPLAEFYGQRFPHPLVTSVYLFSYIYIVAKINKSNNLFIKPKYIYLLGIITILLINSFFFHFIKISIFLLVFSIYKYKKKFFEMLKVNSSSIIIFSILLICGFTILLIQLYFAEDDYSSRLGTHKINWDEKFFILQIFIKKLFQIEIIFIIFLSFLARLNYKKLGITANDSLNYDILFIFFISCLLSPFIFIIFTTTSIYLYYFWSAVKFSGFLFLFVVVIKIFYNFVFKFNFNIKFLSLFFSIILILLNINNNFSYQKNVDYQIINDRNEVKIFLTHHNYINSKKILFSDDYPIMHLWLKLKNKYLINTHGFVSSYSDQTLENLKLNYFKTLNLDFVSFENLLIENENTTNSRNNFATTFGYKYSVNSVRHDKPIQDEYSPTLQKRILKTSPLVQWNHFFSNSEKKRLLNKYKNFKLNIKLMPEIFILQKLSINTVSKDHIISLDYAEIFSNRSFVILEKKN